MNFQDVRGEVVCVLRADLDILMELLFNGQHDSAPLTDELHQRALLGSAARDHFINQMSICFQLPTRLILRNALLSRRGEVEY